MSSASMDMSGDTQPSALRVWGIRFAIFAGIALFLYAVGVGVMGLFSGHTAQKKPITNIKILPDTPPPPPPPPKETPKEQPKEMKVEPPKPQEAPPAPVNTEALKMEGAAGDGPSPFVAGPVTSEYKGGDVGTKIGGRKSAHQFAFYTDQIKTLIEETLARDKQLASGQYKVVVRIWLKPDGHLARFELTGSSGDGATDRLIKAALATLPPLQERPPEDMPQPVKLRITAKNAG